MEGLTVTKCTKETPWSIERRDGGIVTHVDARLIFSDYHGSYFECPNCGIRYELVRDEEPREVAPNGRARRDGGS